MVANTPADKPKLSRQAGVVDTIFVDRRRADERRSRDHQADVGSFVHCRRNRDRDRRSRNNVLLNGCWWLQTDYVDWEAGSSDDKR